jgi:hypothetical protein
VIKRHWSFWVVLLQPLHNKGSPFSLAHKDKIEVMPKDLTFTMTSVAMISDICGRI